MDIRIRKVRGEDADGLVPLFEAFYGAWFGEQVTPASVRRRLRRAAGTETFVVARRASRIVGFAGVRLVASLDHALHAEVTELYVPHGHRRGGVARRLLEHLESLATRRGASHVVVLTGRDNRGARSLYRATGYVDYAVALRKPLAKVRRAGGREGRAGRRAAPPAAGSRRAS